MFGRIGCSPVLTQQYVSQMELLVVRYESNA